METSNVGRAIRPHNAIVADELGPSSGQSLRDMRVATIGKHLLLGSDRHVVRGVTYGSFLPRDDGARYPEPGQLQADLQAMASMGFNTIRTYDLPPVDLLLAAEGLGLRLLVGLHYHDWRYEPVPGRKANDRVVDQGRQAIQALFDRLDDSGCSPGTVLAVSVGNEVPGDLVRVHGIGAVEDSLATLISDVHSNDPDMLATYTNFPTTEYLDPAGQDLTTFNVFLEQVDSFERYLRHLQVASGSRPLLITELGLPSGVHGPEHQASVVGRQLRIVDQIGCAGATIFSWTDEWGVDGSEVPGWGFGLTDEQRNPKPVATEATTWARSSLKDLQTNWPRVSVVVCAYNEERTIEECLTSLERSDYPDLEVIVCDDGSTDDTLALASRYPFTTLALPHGGLSTARNAGAREATGDIVAFLDADAMCHPQWPWYLALAFDDDSVSAVGGPNLPVPGAGLVERAVALSPGAPTEVLTGDDRAEHIAGCNMAFRADALWAVEGFNPRYTAAGDDVDVCWKLLDRGDTIGFNPAAQVIHHRRATVSGYLRQQRGYGRAEALLTQAHPGRFNRLGQARWSGFIYGGVGLLPRLLRPVVYHGHQGSAPFQPVSLNRSSLALSWATACMPLVLALGLAGTLLALVNPAFWLAPFVVVAGLVVFAGAVAVSVDVDRREPSPLKLRMLVAALHVAQPIARTWGRVRSGRSALKERSSDVAASVSGAWIGDRAAWLVDLEQRLRAERLPVVHPPSSSDWDLVIPLGPFARSRVVTAVAWEWTPHWRIGWQPRIGVVVGAVALAGAVATSWALGVVVGGLVAGMGAIEWRRHRQVRSLVAASVESAATSSS